MKTITSHSCPLCGTNDNPPAFRITRTVPHFTVSRCAACGHLYMDPPPARAALEKMYGREYYAGTAAYSYTDERKNPRGFQAVARARISKLLALLRTSTGSGRAFLDIGCSFGSLLDAARAAGCRTTGLDISPYALAHVRKQGHRAIKGVPETARLGKELYDIVTMVEVIEHLGDPAAALHRIRNALKPGGVLLVQTANMEGRQAVRAGADYHYFLPGHLQYFSRRRLTALLDECGFADIRCHYPCEFGLLPKLRKSRGEFKKAADYLRWIPIILYHLKSKIHCGNWALTSGMVLTARRK